MTLESDESVPDSEVSQFSDFLAKLLKDLAYEAVNSPSGHKFAAKEENFLGSMKVYSLAQCTPDLSVFDCNTCLQGAISSIGNCCDGKRGARSLLPSCNIRYEFYSFYNVSAVSTQPQLSPPSSGIYLYNDDIVIVVLNLFLGCHKTMNLRRKEQRRYDYWDCCRNCCCCGASHYRLLFLA